MDLKDIDYKIIGKNIRNFRKQKHLTQQNLAEKLNISLSYLSKIECGQKPASIEIYHRIAKFFRVDVSAILDNPEPQKDRCAMVIHDIHTILDDMEPRELYALRHLLKEYQTAIKQYDNIRKQDWDSRK